MPHTNPARNVPGLHFTSDHFPVSSTFALFLELAAFGKSSIPPNLDWGDQVTEKMHGPGASLPEFRQKIVRDAANRAFNTPIGRDQRPLSALVEKQTRNEARKWPGWRTAEPGKAIEHVRDPHPRREHHEITAHP